MIVFLWKMMLLLLMKIILNLSLSNASSFCEYTKISHTHTPTLEPIPRNMYHYQVDVVDN
jgi:hypothetical protein